MRRYSLAWMTMLVMVVGWFGLEAGILGEKSFRAESTSVAAAILANVRRIAPSPLADLIDRCSGMPNRTRCAGGLKNLSLALAAAAPALDVDALQPGLLTTFHNPDKIEILCLEPTIAIALKAGEAAHPRLAADCGTIRWEGFINILRPGLYRFDAVLRGKLRVTVAAKEVLNADVTAETPVARQGPETQLESGIHPIAAEFTRHPGSARVELFWQAPHFHREPLPYDHVFHLPAQVPGRLGADQLVERGRFLAEENNCTRCHQPADNDRMAKGLASRQGPDLSQVGQRVFPGWIEHWLASPQKVRPGAVMPEMFSNDEAGRVERYAVARYLASLGRPARTRWRELDPKERRKQISHGERLFTSLGCIACHRSEANRQDHGLGALGSKMTPEQLAAYLANPLAIDPSGRMPHMVLQGDEARGLALYLCQQIDAKIQPQLSTPPAQEQLQAAFRRVDPRPQEITEFKRRSVDGQCLDLGKRLVIEKGCNNCHTIAPNNQPFANVLAHVSFEDLKQPRTHTRGCLAEMPDAKAPRFAFGDAERKAVRLFLKEGTVGAGSPAPTYAAQIALERFNCLACHSRNGAGGLTPELTEELRLYEKAENAEAVSPPPLTGVGHKLRTPWLRQVLVQAGRARPWMGLRMPQFGEANVGRLPEALAALEGAEPEDRLLTVSLTTTKIEAGRLLAGKNALGCISCHDLAGIPNTGTRGPDLALMNQRVRHDWYRRWLEQPQRMQPGTRMPMVFPDGKSTLTNILGGSADGQADALWAYLSLGLTLPLPEGMEPPKGLVLTVKDRPIIVRTFMPDAGSRAVAVGYPKDVSIAFDAATCRLAYAWSGNFLDASAAWNNRGGAPAKVLGTRFWTAPPGCPWAATTSHERPDFAAQARDPAYGAAMPEGKVYDGLRRLQFAGYVTDRVGSPTFRYRINADEEHPVEVQEQPAPLRGPAGVGLARQFTLDVPAEVSPWLRAGGSSQMPRVLDVQGAPVLLHLKEPYVKVPAHDRMVLLPQGAGRVVLLRLMAAPPGTCWLLRRQGGMWQTLLSLPRTTAAQKVKVHLNAWVPYRDDPELLKALLSQK